MVISTKEVLGSHQKTREPWLSGPAAVRPAIQVDIPEGHNCFSPPSATEKVDNPRAIPTATPLPLTSA